MTRLEWPRAGILAPDADNPGPYAGDISRDDVRQGSSYCLRLAAGDGPAELQEGFRIIRSHTTTPLAVGEVFNSIHDCQQLITEQLIDFIRATVAHAGGLTHLVRIAHLAELYHVRTGCHGPVDLSPVNLAASLHFGLAVHNFGIQEYMRHTEDTDRVFPHAYAFDDGYLHPGDRPGLGVDVDTELAAAFPYRRAYLPVNRKLDGTVHSW